MKQFFIIIYKGLITFTVILCLFPKSAPAQTNWEKFPGNPVLDVGPPGAWDEQGVLALWVLFDDTTYHMWYTGFDANFTARLGYATSPDGITWTKFAGNPVLDAGPPGSWDERGPGSPSVIFVGTTYHMWYDASDGSNPRIGYATSPDRVTWTKYSANPVLDVGPSGSWDDESVFAPSVIYDGTIYHMWFSGGDGTNGRIGYVTSPNGVTWTEHAANPVLDVGPPGSWDDESVTAPSVIYDGTTYHMWYEGKDGSFARTGYATSPDRVTWTKFANYPVLDVGPPGTWDESFASSAEVIFNGSSYQMWYNGASATNFIFSIGYAVDTTITSVIEHDGEIPTAFTLDQNYPNPFNPNTIIRYQIPELSFVTLKVYDVLGSEIISLVNEEKPVGVYEVELNAKGLPSGIYFYSLQVYAPGRAGSFVETKKMVLMK